MLIVIKYGSLNLLEPSGSVQGCNGTALSLVNERNVGLFHISQNITTAGGKILESRDAVLQPRDTTHRQERNLTCAASSPLPFLQHYVKNTLCKKLYLWHKMFLLVASYGLVYETFMAS